MKNNGFYVILDENIDVRMAKSSLLQTMAFKAGYHWGNKVDTVGHTKSQMIGFGTWTVGDLTHQPEAKPKMGRNGKAELVSFEEALKRLLEQAKPEFKIGDWVRRKEGYTDYPGRAFEIDEFNNRENSEKRGIYYPGEPKEWDYTHTFRYATKTEISDAQKVIFKVGNWITITKAPGQHSQWIGWTDKITSVTSDRIDTSGSAYGPNGLCFTRNSYEFRAATPMEILNAEEKMNKLVIAGYEVKFGSDISGIGCEEHYNHDWVSLAKYMEIFNIKSVEHKSGPIVDITEIEALVKRLKI